MAIAELGGVAPNGNPRRKECSLYDRSRRTRGITYDGAFEAGAGCGDTASDQRLAGVTGGPSASGVVHFRRHRSAALCRRLGRADHFIIWSKPSRALGTHWADAYVSYWVAMRLRRKLSGVYQPKSLHGGYFAGTGMGTYKKI